MDRHEHIASLIAAYNRGELTSSQEEELSTWTSASARNEELFRELTDPDTLARYLLQVNRYDREASLEKIRETLSLDEANVRPVPLWKKLSIAASVSIALTVSAYFLFFDRKQHAPLVQTPATIQAPSLTKATIRLADGREISIDSLTWVSQGDVQVVKSTDGIVSYSGRNAETIYNTLVNPRGSVVANLTLSDGTKVWLNSESSLRYPVSFNGDTRTVEITGEAYFEVAASTSPDPSKGGGKKRPFIVTANGLTTEVLGTHFNINTYPDESSKNVTLLEGSIRTSPGPSERGVILKPGQQARVTHDVTVTTLPDPEQVVAWKNGMFEFTSVPLPVIMRQISRWYDVEVIMQATHADKKFGGGLGRNLPLSEVMSNLETYGVQFELVGRKLYVN